MQKTGGAGKLLGEHETSPESQRPSRAHQGKEGVDRGNAQENKSRMRKFTSFPKTSRRQSGWSVENVGPRNVRHSWNNRAALNQSGHTKP